MANYLIAKIVIFCCMYVLCSGCTFPAYLRGSWLSSEKNELVFADSSLSGFKVATFDTDIFTCIEEYSGKYVLKSESFKRFGLSFYAYLCLDLQQVTDVTTGDLYKYYRATPEQSDANNERVLFKLATFSQATGSEVCTVTDYTSVPYSVLMKNGTIENVKSNCGIPFLGNFAYTYDTGSGNLCNSSAVTVCTDKTTMTWDYTQCSQIQAYSAGGVTNCILSTEVNSLYTIHVYNQDTTTDQSTTYRFTCYRAKGYGTVYATQYPGDCPSSMNETYVASPGAALVMSSSLLCAYDESSSTLSAGVIAAIVIIVLLILALIAAAVIYYLYQKRKKKKQAEWEAANRKVDPDELSPNMRLGLPDETRYDLDRLMYSPDNMKNGLIKRSQRKDMMGLEGLEGYNEGQLYMDEDQRQTALEAHMYAEKRKRKDNKDEFKAAEKTNKVFSDRIKDLAKGRKRPIKALALAKLKFRPKAKPKADTGPEDDRGTTTKDIVIQVEEAGKQGQTEGKRKTRFADEDQEKKTGEDKIDSKKAKKLEDVETLSDIADNENAVDDLSDDETKEPRLILPNLNAKKDKRKRRNIKIGKQQRKKVVVSRYIPYQNTPFVRKVVLFRPTSGVPKKKKTAWHAPPKLRPRSKPWSAMIRRLRNARANTISPMPSVPTLRHKLHGLLNCQDNFSILHNRKIQKRPKDRFSLGPNPQTPGMPHNTRYMPPKSRQKSPQEFTEPLVISRNTNHASLPPLARIHRKDNPRAWKEAFGDKTNGMESIDIESLKKRLPENRWKRLLEELYRDKKYFDYVKKSTTTSEKDLMSSADESLQYLYGRALFWELQEPIPARPPSHVKRMYSRYESPKTSGLQRSSTTLSRSGHKRVPRTPSTQVSRLKKRENLSKKKKDILNKSEAKQSALPEFFEGGTQTDFSPIPMTPVMISDINNIENDDGRFSSQGSVALERFETPVIPFTKEVTKSDIKLEEFDTNMFDEEDPNYMYQPYQEEDVKVGV